MANDGGDGALDELVLALGELYSFLDIDLSSLPVLARSERFLKARVLIVEAAETVALAQNRAKEGDPTLLPRAQRAVALAQDAVKKARGLVFVARLLGGRRPPSGPHGPGAL
jgi:hypothetical protein